MQHNYLMPSTILNVAIDTEERGTAVYRIHKMHSSYGGSQIVQKFINWCAFYQFTQLINCINSQIAPNRYYDYAFIVMVGTMKEMALTLPKNQP